MRNDLGKAAAGQMEHFATMSASLAPEHPVMSNRSPLSLGAPASGATSFSNFLITPAGLALPGFSRVRSNSLTQETP